MMAARDNYKWLHNIVKPNGCIVFFKEYSLGHCAFLMPKDRTVYSDMLKVIKDKNKDGDLSVITAGGVHRAKDNACCIIF